MAEISAKDAGDESQSQPLMSSTEKERIYLEDEDSQEEMHQNSVGAAMAELIIIASLLIAWKGFSSVMPLNERDIPEGVLANGVRVVNDSALSYPVFLKGQKCTAEDIFSCTAGGAAAAAAAACCTALADPAHRGPEETVPFHKALAVCVLLPTAYFCFRAGRRGPSSNAGEHGGGGGGGGRGKGLLAAGLRDGVGLGLALSLTLFLVGLAKRLAGRPRPNFYALVAYASGSAADRTHLATVAYESFPSGHAATTLAAMVFLALCVFRDTRDLFLNNINASTRPLLLFFWLLIASPVVLAFWVGLTRLSDYWHSFDDVAAGWLIGVAGAAFGYSYLACTSPSRSYQRDGAYVLLRQRLAGDGL